MRISTEIRVATGVVRIEREATPMLPGLPAYSSRQRYTYGPASYWLNDEPISEQQAYEVLQVKVRLA